MSDKSVDIYTAAACVGGGGDVIHCNVLSLCTGVAMNLALDNLGCRLLWCVNLDFLIWWWFFLLTVDSFRQAGANPTETLDTLL